MDDTEKQSRRGAQALALINDELLNEAFDVIEAKCMKEWMETRVKDSQPREDAWRMMQVILKVKEHLNVVLAEGKLADRKITDINSKTRILGLVI